MLVGYFVAAVAVVAVLLGTLAWASRPDGEGGDWWHWFRATASSVLDQPSPLRTGPETSTLREATGYAIGLFRLLIPTLFLGLIVFKVLVSRDILVFRERVALRPTPAEHDLLKPGGHFLAVRFYTASPLTIVDLCTQALTENWRETAESGRVRRIRKLNIVNPDFPLGHPRMPYTLQLPLNPGDVEVDDAGGARLVAVQGHEVGPDDRLHIIVTGRIPALGNEFVETHTYLTLTDVEHAPFAAIDVDFDRPPEQWSGWDRFDGDDGG